MKFNLSSLAKSNIWKSMLIPPFIRWSKSFNTEKNINKTAIHINISESELTAVFGNRHAYVKDRSGVGFLSDQETLNSAITEMIKQLQFVPGFKMYNACVVIEDKTDFITCKKMKDESIFGEILPEQSPTFAPLLRGSGNKQTQEANHDLNYYFSMPSKVPEKSLLQEQIIPDENRAENSITFSMQKIAVDRICSTLLTKDIIVRSILPYRLAAIYAAAHLNRESVASPAGMCLFSVNKKQGILLTISNNHINLGIRSHESSSGEDDGWGDSTPFINSFSDIQTSSVSSESLCLWTNESPEFSREVMERYQSEFNDPEINIINSDELIDNQNTSLTEIYETVLNRSDITISLWVLSLISGNFKPMGKKDEHQADA